MPHRSAQERTEDRDRLFAIVYDELRALASAHLRGERRGHTLQTTALVHEAYLRLSRREDLEGRPRAEFLSIAAEAIRRVLVDHARRRGAAKRGGSWDRTALHDGLGVTDGDAGVDVLALDEALGRLAELNERQARIVELRFFAGLEVDEVARTLGLSPRTVAGDWSMAKAWLYGELSGGTP